MNVTRLKPRLLRLAEKIFWVPEHIKQGRFGKWLEGAQDWSISRQRFWGSVIPIWKCQGEKSEIRSTKSPTPPKQLRLRRPGETNQNGQKFEDSNFDIVSNFPPEADRPLADDIHASDLKKRCDAITVIGSISELEELSGQKIKDLHKHIVDEITFPCEKCGGEMRRIPDVLDCWFESAAMPYAQIHYPFENKEKFEQHFPADFIAEGVDQTRCWFYYMLVLSCALMDKEPFKNVIANGIVLAEDGQKMSKHLKNYPDPAAEVEKYGADALRYYLLTSPVMKAENLLFSEKGVEEVYKKVVLILSNVLSFYKLYASQGAISPISNFSAQGGSAFGGQFPICLLRRSSFGCEGRAKQIQNPNDRIITQLPNYPITPHVLDHWLLSRLHALITTVTAALDTYDLVEASRPLASFIDDLSTWYIRRSRDRCKSGDQNALLTTHYSLLTFSKLIAPFMPFMAEWIWQEISMASKSQITNHKSQTNPNNQTPNSQTITQLPNYPITQSVHLSPWPQADPALINQELMTQMSLVRHICEFGHALRAEANIKVRQPLGELQISLPTPSPFQGEGWGEVRERGMLDLLKDELNVKAVNIVEKMLEGPCWISKTDGTITVALQTTLTDDLKEEGLIRDLTRTINGMRKEAGLTISDRVSVTMETIDESLKNIIEKNKTHLLQEVLANDLVWGKVEGKEVGKVKVAISQLKVKS